MLGCRTDLKPAEYVVHRRLLFPAGKVSAAGLIVLLVTAPVAAQTTDDHPRVHLSGQRVRTVANGVLGLMAYSIVPDNTANSITMTTGEDQTTSLTMGQIGAGFTVSDSVPLYLEGFIGYSRYDPKFIFSDGQETRLLPTRWNTVTATVGVGWDFKLTDELTLRPIVNLSYGHMETDASLGGRLLNYLTDHEIQFLSRGRMNVAGIGGAMVLGYALHKPAYEIDVELRYSQFHMESLPGTSRAVMGVADPITLGLWSRLRIPTGLEMFGEPLRYVFEVSHSQFYGSQTDALGFDSLTKLGGGLEVDVGKYEIGALGLYVTRVRLLGRYVFGPNVSGFSMGLGISF